MARKIILTVTAITLVILTSRLAAEQPGESNAVGIQTPQAPPGAARPKPRVEVVTMADFYMRDGNTVSGKLLSDDSTQVVIEQMLESTIIAKTYSKREIDTRTLRTRPMPEYQYYMRLGEYFAARTWDFRDDPDDFIGAIRCYEKAKQSLQASGADEERISEADKAIKKLKDDKEVWTSQVESRAKLKRLEYDAEAENRLKQLEKQVAESNVRLNESIKYLDKTAEDIKTDYQKTEKAIGDLNKDFVQQIRNLQTQIQDNQASINDIWFRCCFRPRAPASPSGG
jgi:hypothetical protein